MKLQTMMVTGCGSEACFCAGTEVSRVIPSINGVKLLQPDRRPDKATLAGRARDELLRQQAVTLGLLPRHDGVTAPELTTSRPTSTCSCRGRRCTCGIFFLR
jgi:hypothetical protein